MKQYILLLVLMVMGAGIHAYAGVSGFSWLVSFLLSV